MEKLRHSSLKEKMNRGLVAVAIFIACPGDDIFALIPSVVNVDVSVQISPTRTLGLFYLHKRQEDEHEFFPWTKPIKPQKTTKF